eukprot:jgi/Tetstr1/449168/TSEL_036377.t1
MGTLVSAPRGYCYLMATDNATGGGCDSLAPYVDKSLDDIWLVKWEKGTESRERSTCLREEAPLTTPLKPNAPTHLCDRCDPPGLPAVWLNNLLCCPWVKCIGRRRYVWPVLPRPKLAVPPAR